MVEPMLRKKTIIELICIIISMQTVSSANIEDVPCSVIRAVWDAMRTIAPSLIIIMFMYGAAKYVFSAEEPGARQQGKSICIHALIGGIILAILSAIVSMTGIATSLCQGITF
jgi:hypothetical protein